MKLDHLESDIPLSYSTENPWNSACDRLIDAVSPNKQATVRSLLTNVHNGGAGLRDWVSSIAYRGARLPDRIPDELVGVYASDPEAAPLHDCESCGVAVPVRPSRVHGMEGDPEEQYFPVCPVCGGRTGPYFYWSRQAESASTLLRRRKPR